MRRKYSIFQLTIPAGEILDYPDWYYESRKALRGRCLWCGETVTGRGLFCRQNDHRVTSASRAQVSSLRKAVHMAYGFQCAICKFTFERQTPAGYRVPKFWGEVDHKVALVNGGEDDWLNLQLLCSPCHASKTRTDLRKKDTP